jgi:FKBP-type peptidyl-prolyl cis-trans isomerase SlyD
MGIENDSVVTIKYTLKDDKGQVIDSSEQHGDLSYLHGHQNIVPGLEEALDGKAVGDQVQTQVEPEKGYGERQDQLVFQVPRDRLPQDEELQLGMQFRAQSSEGQELVVTLVDLGDEEVTLDANHPLAGQNLNFDVEVKDVRDATEEEIEHGHAHGAEGHEH